MSGAGGRRTVFVLVRRDWRYNDDFWYGDDAVARAYPTREAAERAMPRGHTPDSRHAGYDPYEIVEVPVVD